MGSRRRFTVWAGIGVTGLAATGLSISVGSDRVSAGVRTSVSTAAHAILDASSVLSLRSPGERAAGAVARAKPARASRIPAIDTRKKIAPAVDRSAAPQRGLPFIRESSPATAGTLPGILTPDIAAAPGSVSGVVGSTSPLTTGGSGGGSSFVGGGIGGAFPVVGGGGGAPPGGTTPPPGGIGSTPVPNTPVSAVPEPTTWVTMIMGFFLIAGVMRRRARNSGAARPALD